MALIQLPLAGTNNTSDIYIAPSQVTAVSPSGAGNCRVHTTGGGSHEIALRQDEVVKRLSASDEPMPMVFG